jgi:ATP-dependent DNA helicase PIF1
MISAHFFNQVSERLSIAKGSDPSTAGKPFGGVNLIVTGDLGQLPPVNAASLFSHTLVKQLNTNITETPKGQEALNGAFLWRQINKVIILKNNERAKKDKPFINLLSRVREGCAWKNQKSSVMHQDKPEENYQMGDYETLLSRRLQLLVNNDKSTMDQFKHAPIVVGEKVFRDALNNKIVQSFAKKTGQDLHWYHADDTFHGQPLKNNLRKRMLRSPSNITDDAIGMLPLVPGMRVMITDNLAMRGKVANGCQGILYDIKYEINNHGERKAICAYVQVDGARIQAPGLPPDVIPIMAEKTTFNYKVADELTYYITRWQLPLLPAYAFTVNKIQGQSLEKAIVDLRSAKGTQALYVMISRATALENLAVLRWFPSTNVDRRLSEAYRNEFERLQLLDERTNLEFKTRKY